MRNDLPLASWSEARPLRLFIVAAESSGDELGARLIASLREMVPQGVELGGVGGPAMERAGLSPLYSSSELAVMGPTHIIPKLPRIIRLWRLTVREAVTFRPDVLVIIDSPDFTKLVAKGLRKRMPHVPVVKYVAPQVWAWRPGRAPKMRAYLDHILAFLPFEPAFYEKIGGPRTSYVGHPLVERLAQMRPDVQEAEARTAHERPTLLLLPGSRSNEVARLMQPFGEALRLISERYGSVDAVLPAVPHLKARIEEAVASWPVKPRIIDNEADKYAAFRRARAALAASGTVTLELALAHIPMVVAYKVENWLVPLLRRLIVVDTAVLAHHVIGEKFVPEFLQDSANGENLCNALLPLLEDGPDRAAQLDAFRRIDHEMQLEGATPSQRAAQIVLQTIADKRVSQI